MLNGWNIFRNVAIQYRKNFEVAENNNGSELFYFISISFFKYSDDFGICPVFGKIARLITVEQENWGNG